MSRQLSPPPHLPENKYSRPQLRSEYERQISREMLVCYVLRLGVWFFVFDDLLVLESKLSDASKAKLMRAPPYRRPHRKECTPGPDPPLTPTDDGSRLKRFYEGANPQKSKSANK